MISLLGSSKCNLSCSFCYLGKNPFYQKYDEKVKKAWETGEYLKTVKKVLKKLDSDPLKVTEVQLWGGEPSLYFNLIAKKSKELGNLFPNLLMLHIPTNFFKTDMKSFIDLAIGLNDSITPRDKTDKDFGQLQIHLQASIDGPPGDFNTYGHKVSWEQYKKNFDELIDNLKTINRNLDNILIDLAICPCSSQDIILKNLDTYEKIKEFRLFYNKAFDYMRKRVEEISNVEIRFLTRYITPRVAISQDTTTEESLKLNNLIRLLDLSDYNNLENCLEPPGEAYFYHDCHGAYSIYERNHECYESNESCITLLPDGTIAECPCTFFHNEKEFQQEYLNNKDYWGYKSCLVRENNFFNPLENDDEKEKDHDWYVYNGGFLGTTSTYDCLNFNMALELALSRQIDYNYILDQDKFFEHYRSDYLAIECYRENINVTHNPLIADLNNFRRWFNGTTELSHNQFKSQLLKIIELETQ